MNETFPHEEARAHITAEDFEFLGKKKKADSLWFQHGHAGAIAKTLYAGNFLAYRNVSKDSLEALKMRIIKTKDLLETLPEHLRTLCGLQSVPSFIEEFKKEYDVRPFAMHRIMTQT